jgi:hypothetical protein
MAKIEIGEVAHTLRSLSLWGLTICRKGRDVGANQTKVIPHFKGRFMFSRCSHYTGLTDEPVESPV